MAHSKIPARRSLMKSFLFVVFVLMSHFSLVLAEDESEMPPPTHVDVLLSLSHFSFEFARKDGAIHQYELRISNLETVPELSHMKELRWTLNANNEVEARALAQRLVQRFLEFEKSFDDFRELLLIEGILRSETKVFIDEEGKSYAIRD